MRSSCKNLQKKGEVVVPEHTSHQSLAPNTILLRSGLRKEERLGALAVATRETAGLSISWLLRSRQEKAGERDFTRKSWIVLPAQVKLPEVVKKVDDEGSGGGGEFIDRTTLAP